jgi:hypothetical protein
MGRYANRFQAGGSVGVGATYRAAAGGGNTKFAVAANGQSLIRTNYPALSSFYSGQTELDTSSILANASVSSTLSGLVETTARQNNTPGRQGNIAQTFSGFTIYLQETTVRSTPNLLDTAVWYTVNGVDWKCSFPFSTPVTGVPTIVTGANCLYILHQQGIYRTTDGLNFDNVYSQGSVIALTESGNVVIFCTGDNFVLSTTDFNTINRVNNGITDFTSLVNFSGALYAFASGVTGVYSSVNTGNTWSSVTPSGLITAGGGNAAVLNGRILVTTTGTGPIYQSSNNPTGSIGVWQNAPTNKQTDALIQQFVYDATDNVLICTPRLELTASSVYAYTFTGFSGAFPSVTGFQRLTGAVQNITPESGNFGTTNGAVNPFALRTPDFKGIYIGSIGAYEPTGTTWSGNTNITLATGATSLAGFRSSPFFPAARWASGYYALGTTNSGSRYIAKGTNSNATGILRYLSIYVEESGFFKLLKTPSTGYFSNNNFTDSDLIRPFSTGGIGGNTFVLSETATGYNAAWVAPGSGIIYNTFSKTNKSASNNFIRSTAFTPNSSGAVIGAVKNGAIHILPTSGYTGASSLQSFYISPTGGLETLTTLVGNPISGSPSGRFYFSNVDNEVIVSLNGTGGVLSAIALTLSGTTSTSFAVTLRNTTGATLGAVAGTTFFKSNNTYYAYDPSGSLFKGDTLGQLTLVPEGVTPPIPTLATSLLGSTIRQISPDTFIGAMFIKSNFGKITTSNIASPTGNLNFVYSQYNTCSYFSLSSGVYAAQTVGTANPFLIQTAGSGSFIVPNITSPVTGEAVYIIAR